MTFVLLTPRCPVAAGPLRCGRKRLFFFALGAVVGASAYAMSSYSIGGWVETLGGSLFSIALFLFFHLHGAYWYMRRGESLQKIRWMWRAVGILLGIATTRPVMGVLFFATSRWTHLEPSQFFGIAFWIGFSINTIIVELWLRSRET